jgi:S1-C subfamily serine protease
VALVHTWEGDVHMYCAGVWVGEKTILTANHCMEGIAHRVAMEQAVEGGADPMAIRLGLVQLPEVDPSTLTISFIVRDEVVAYGENPTAIHTARVLALDPNTDLALLTSLNTPVHKVAKLAKNVDAVGEHVFTMGHPAGLYWTFMEGVVSAFHDHLGPKKDLTGPFIQVEMPIFQGNSGGGLFNQFGELEGVASFMPPDAPSVGFFVHLQNIKEFMAANKLAKLDLTSKKADASL